MAIIISITLFATPFRALYSNVIVAVIFLFDTYKKTKLFTNLLSKTFFSPLPPKEKGWQLSLTTDQYRAKS